MGVNCSTASCVGGDNHNSSIEEHARANTLKHKRIERKRTYKKQPSDITQMKRVMKDQSEEP